MKKLTLLLFLLSLFQQSQAQNSSPALSFNGTNSYVNLGSDVGNGFRTVEMWFKLDNEITPNLSEFVTLVAREISLSNNSNEFSLSFQPSHVANPGTLRFDIEGTLPFKSVYSDNNTWLPNKWYHVAAVIHEDNGMMLFINGIKQLSTHHHNKATGTSSHISTLGCWGDYFRRYFTGDIEDFRISNEALYLNNFTPKCPDETEVTASTIGLWNFNEGSGDITKDISTNESPASLHNTSWTTSNICGNAIAFDGNDDYINLGSDAGDGFRTIEMWFKLDEEVTPNLSEFVTLAAREISLTNNSNEFSLSFQPSHVANPGTLRFDVDGTLPFKSVYSDNNTWIPHKWYHVAAVIHEDNGMMLFVNGKKQSSTHPYSFRTAQSHSITTIGSWGDYNQRFFKGTIEDVRITTDAIYSTNFIPSCLNLIEGKTNGFWDFNKWKEEIVFEQSRNMNHATLVGATRVLANICPTPSSIDTSVTVSTGIYKESARSKKIKLYPNPSSGVFQLVTDEIIYSKITIYNTLGQIVFSKQINPTLEKIDISNNPSGAYFYRITKDNLTIQSGKLIKK